MSEGNGERIHGSGENSNFYKLASEQGRLDGQFILATCYENGHGHLDAQFILAKCYQKGHGVAKNLDKAFRFYKRAADQGDVEAQFNIAFCYEKGIGTEKSRDDALAFYKRAADQGFDKARSKLDVYNVEDATKKGTKEHDDHVEPSSGTTDGSQTDPKTILSRGEEKEQKKVEESMGKR